MWNGMWLKKKNLKSSVILFVILSLCLFLYLLYLTLNLRARKRDTGQGFEAGASRCQQGYIDPCQASRVQRELNQFCQVALEITG